GLKPAKNQHIAFEGEMVQGEEFHYYVCSRAGLYISFSFGGDIIGVFHTLDATEPPEIIEREYNNLTMFERQPDEIVNYDAASDGKDLFILSTVAFETSDRMRIDRYDSRGTYKGSMQVPNHRGNLPVSIAVSAHNGIWVLYEDLYVIRYDLYEVQS
ncbi:MAG: hypothetical protein P8X57_02190, partial [Cyclobacteriaceae bacterium]